MKRVATRKPQDAPFAQALQRVQRYMHHPFLACSGIEQRVSRFHFDLTHWLLSEAGVPAEEHDTVVDAVLLLQQGLSIHDHVDTAQGLSRQLMVLAGDYDSSHYYWLLASHGLAEVIQALSAAVAEINEAKMDLLAMMAEENQSTWALDRLETMEGALLVALARVYHADRPDVEQQLRAQIRRHVSLHYRTWLPHLSAAVVDDWRRSRSCASPAVDEPAYPLGGRSKGRG